MNSYKYEDLVRILGKLEAHSKKGDIVVGIDRETGSLSFNYTSSHDTETTIDCYPSETNKFVTITEKVWLRK